MAEGLERLAEYLDGATKRANSSPLDLELRSHSRISSTNDPVDFLPTIAENIQWKGESRVVTLVVTLSLSGAGTPC